MSVDFMDADAALAAMELQARVDKAAREYLDEQGRLPTVLRANPSEPHAGRVVGYTVVLDPEQPLGRLELK